MLRTLPIVIVLLAHSVWAEDLPPMVITDAITNFTSPATILIEGQQFRPGGLRDPDPQVFIGVQGGILQPLEILNATNTAIVARLTSTFVPGSYRLVVY